MGVALKTVFKSPAWPRLSALPRTGAHHAARRCGLALCSLALSGCAVIAVADVAASAVVGVAGLAVDAAVGTARIGGKAIGKTADAVLDSSDPEAE